MGSRLLGALGAASFLAWGCGAGSAPQPAQRPVVASASSPAPPERPPTPASVSVKEPGGDAPDPHAAALWRQLTEPWGARNDKDDQLHVPTPDWEHWKRVRYWGVEHFSGWRYGDDHHVAAAAVLLDVERGAPHTSELCLQRFDAAAVPKAKRLGVSIAQRRVVTRRWRDKPLFVEVADGWIDSGFSRKHYSAAWGAYAAYPDACLIYFAAFAWRDQEALAKRARDRWVEEGFSRVNPLTPTRPYRK